MPYKLLALDMDGTLLSSSKTVLPRTREALQNLEKTGVPLAYCSGRCFSELMDYPSELPFVRYGVLASGAVVYDFHARHTLRTTCLDTDVVCEAMDVARAQHPMPHVMATSVSVVRPDDARNMGRFGMGVYQEMFQKICVLASDLNDWVRRHPGEVVKLNFYHSTPEERDLTRTRLVASGLPLTLANAEETSVECSPLGVSKAKGLETLAEHLGIGLEDVVAVGDSDNDAAALMAVGMPVAMGNATESIRRTARLVVADNDHDGIAQAVRELF